MKEVKNGLSNLIHTLHSDTVSATGLLSQSKQLAIVDFVEKFKLQRELSYIISYIVNTQIRVLCLLYFI